MKKHWIFTSSTLTAVIVAVGVILISRNVAKIPEGTSHFPHQMSGQVPEQFSGKIGEKLDHTYLRGGPLQQGLEQAQPEEFLIEHTAETDPYFIDKEFTVHTGKVVSITLRNQSQVNHQHNWTLVKPGTADKVEEAAKNLNSTWQWIPDSSDILALVPLTQPGQSRTILFRAPEEPGDYPFLCTFPGHGHVMNGTLHVLK